VKREPVKKKDYANRGGKKRTTRVRTRHADEREERHFGLERENRRTRRNEGKNGKTKRRFETRLRGKKQIRVGERASSGSANMIYHHSREKGVRVLGQRAHGRGVGKGQSHGKKIAATIWIYNRKVRLGF